MCKSGIYLGWERCPVYGGALISEVQGKGGTGWERCLKFLCKSGNFVGKGVQFRQCPNYRGCSM